MTSTASTHGIALLSTLHGRRLIGATTKPTRDRATGREIDQRLPSVVRGIPGGG